VKTVSFDPFYNQEYGLDSRTTALQKEDSQLRAFRRLGASTETCLRNFEILLKRNHRCAASLQEDENAASAKTTAVQSSLSSTEKAKKGFI
jgi:hypothetical protein